MSSCLGIGIGREKKTKEMMVALPEISEELVIEILIRLPAKSLMRFKCVSKNWLSLISSRYLTNLFLKTSPRSRFYAYLVDPEKQSEYVLLASPNHYHHSDFTVSVKVDQDLTVPPIGGGYFVSSIRGLVCFKNGRRVRICNLNTRQVVELPTIEGNYNDKNVWSCFGYEPVKDEYKVLSTIWEVSEDEERLVTSEHHVLSLGPGASWKKTQNHIPHRPFCYYSEGITINSVLYYVAWTDANRCVLMSFDFSFEEFKLIELPSIVHVFWRLSFINFLNYKGKIAVFRYTGVLSNGTVEVWVLEEDAEEESQWSEKKTFVLPVSEMNFVPGDWLTMGGTGTSRSGQIWLRKSSLGRTEPVCLFIYDLERNKIARIIETRPLLDNLLLSNFLLTFSWDDIESIMYLET